MLGYEHFEGLDWHDAFENACMLLGGMGPVTNPVHQLRQAVRRLVRALRGLVFLVVALRSSPRYCTA
jgi:hypothetical protein